MNPDESVNQWLCAEYRPLEGVRLNLRLDSNGNWPTSSRSQDRSAIDQALISHLRQTADVIVTGSKTALDEGYLPSKWAPIAVVSHSLLPLETQLFTESAEGKCSPLLVTTSGEQTSDPRVLKMIVSDIDAFGAHLLATLRTLGFKRILLETGPNLTAQLFGFVDEICLTSELVPNLEAFFKKSFTASAELRFSEIRDNLTFSRWAISNR